MKNQNLREDIEVLRSRIIQNAFSIKYKRREDKQLREKYSFMKKTVDEVTPARIKKENAELKILKEILLLFPQVEGLVNTNHWWKNYGEMKLGRKSLTDTRDYTSEELKTLIECLDEHKDYLLKKYPNMQSRINSIREEVLKDKESEVA
jgi:hypothetical protein